MNLPWTYEKFEDIEGEWFSVSDSSSSQVLEIDVDSITEEFLIEVIEYINARGNSGGGVL